MSAHSLSKPCGNQHCPKCYLSTRRPNLTKEEIENQKAAAERERVKASEARVEATEARRCREVGALMRHSGPVGGGGSRRRGPKPRERSPFGQPPCWNCKSPTTAGLNVCQTCGSSLNGFRELISLRIDAGVLDAVKARCSDVSEFVRSAIEEKLHRGTTATS